MEIPTKYNPSTKEDKWYKYWMDKGFFKSEPDKRDPYTIVIPPPNVTGVLHMGHMLNNTIQDILVRRARMQGKNACWLPGTDHASIATEARVVAKLNSEGIKKSDLKREEFLKYAWDWKRKHGGIILEQLKKLGASCDWDRTKFTMDENLSESVIDVFIGLYKKGYIYRGVRMVNWDTKAKTAVSDEEVNYKEVQSKLFYVRYRIQNKDDWVTIVTTRPETILGDTAVCVHPEDERYAGLKGKRVLIPLINRPVPVIFDEYVDREFGTGVLKITPAHDLNDYEIGIKHHLESIDILNDDGTLNENAQLFVGEDRFKARELITENLRDKGYLVKVENYINKVGFSERTNAVIEPKLSVQWFLRMKELARPALENVVNDNIKFHPPKFKNTYKYWMENVKDWCISRQLWWGHRIPAYYLTSEPTGLADVENYVIAKNTNEALDLAKKTFNKKDLTVKDIKQDEDVLDTWFSSWLWPISVFDGIRNPNNADINYYYPTNDLVTAPDILFFWVARMIMAGYEFLNKKPFHNVYLTGIVRDNQGLRMSKSLGNSPDPLQLIDKYGADGVRVGMLLCSPAGNDLLFDESLTEQGRNFCNKIWNAFRLVMNWQVDEEIPQPVESTSAFVWFREKFNQSLKEIEDNYSKYRLSVALMTIYKLFWDDFSSVYLEIVKPAYQEPIDKKTYNETITYFEKLLKVLHPFMPFITEDIWQSFKDRKDKESIMISNMPEATKFNEKTIKKVEYTNEIVSSVRAIRKDKNIPDKEKLTLYFNGDEKAFYHFILKKSGNLTKIIDTSEKFEGAVSFIIRSAEFFIPLGDKVDVEKEIKKFKNEFDYTKGFLKSVIKKLNNKNFIRNAPAKVVELEKTKQADAEAKIKVLEERIAALRK